MKRIGKKVLKRREEVAAMHREFRGEAVDVLRRMIRIGSLLKVLKEDVGHGEFLPFVAEAGISTTQAWRYSKAYSERALLAMIPPADLMSARAVERAVKAAATARKAGEEPLEAAKAAAKATRPRGKANKPETKPESVETAMLALLRGVDDEHSRVRAVERFLGRVPVKVRHKPNLNAAARQWEGETLGESARPLPMEFLEREKEFEARLRAVLAELSPSRDCWRGMYATVLAAFWAWKEDDVKPAGGDR